jgi:hypothetical protein
LRSWRSLGPSKQPASVKATISATPAIDRRMMSAPDYCL